MNRQELQERTLTFALEVDRLIRPLLRDLETRHIAEQLLRSSSSTAANYRAAGVARSKREWIAKIGIAREEADESVLWLVFLNRAGVAPARKREMDDLLDEARQLARILAASYRTGGGWREKKKTGRERSDPTSGGSIDGSIDR